VSTAAPQGCHSRKDADLGVVPHAVVAREWSMSHQHDHRGDTGVLVSGVGGASGYSVAEYATRYFKHVFWSDADAQAPGLLTNRSHALVVPIATAPGYLDFLITACIRRGVTVVSPNVDVEVAVLAQNQDRLTTAGLRVWLSTAEVVEKCRDKWAFWQWGQGWSAASFPATWDNIAAIPPEVIRRGVIAKPRVGSGSSGVRMATSADALEQANEALCDPIFQEAISGNEFSADCLSWRNGPILVHLRRRVSAKAGMSTVTETFTDTVLTERVQGLLSALGYEGPSCVQGFILDNGEHLFTEVNARFGGGCALAEHSGGRLLSRYFDYLSTGSMIGGKFEYEAGYILVRPYKTVCMRR